MKTTERMYDVVVIDLPDPATAVLNRFYTREFFQEARGRMPPDGVLAIAAASTPGLRHFAVVNRNAALFHTLREVFADVLVGGEDMCLFFASGSDRSLTDDASVMAMRYREREVRSEDFTDQHFYTLLRDQTVRRKHWILSHHGRSARSALEPPDTGPLAPVPLREQQALLDGLPAVEHRFFLNSDFHPIGYFHTLIFLQSLQGGGGALLLRRLLRVRLWWIALVAAVVVAAGGMLRLRDDRRTRGSARRYAVSVSAFAIGFASMVFEVTLLFAFQGVYGYVFERIGLIVALFMGGLALGCGVSRRCMTGPSVLRSMVFIQMLFVAFSMLLAVGVPIAASWTTTPWIFAAFALVTLMAGMLNGLHYPPASAGRYHLSGHPERAAGFVYAVELFGACIGSVAASVVLVPVLGLLGACVTAGLVNAAACVVLWIADGA